MSMSVDGLISGMDTTSLISQLMQAEAGPADGPEVPPVQHPDRRVGLPHGEQRVRRPQGRGRGRA